MYYAYTEETIGWNSKKQIQLLSRLSNDLKLPIMGEVRDPNIMSKPHLRLDCFGTQGVYFRKLTAMKEEDRDGLVQLADEIYDEVMEIKNLKNI
jgi:hypothetical protein